jgi:hypothetical protein
MNLKNLSRPDGNRPSIFTLVGEGGLGKTTLAAMFPKPIMIRTEDGVQSIRGADVALFPVSATSDDVFDNIASLLEEEHDFKTLIIDSITQLNTMIEAEVIASDPKHPKSLNQALGGYGAGHGAVSERHREIRQACGYLSQTKGMHIVFISHADSEQVDLPDSDPYSRYTIRMNKKSVGHYSDNVDCVAFLKLRRFLKGEADNKKAVSDGTRIITCYPTPNHISKNRFGINEDLVFDLSFNPFTPYIGE